MVRRFSNLQRADRLLANQDMRKCCSTEKGDLAFGRSKEALSVIKVIKRRSFR